jgi:hypothetical protein
LRHRYGTKNGFFIFSMDQFPFDSTLFEQQNYFEKKRKLTPLNFSPRQRPTDLSIYARDVFYFMYTPTNPSDKYELIGELTTYLEANLSLPKSELYTQTTKAGRWLQFVQFLFTTYLRLAKQYSKRQLRQYVVSHILHEMHRAGVEK